ncbi:GAF domain-containing protein [Deinococcus aquaticus]|uniref:GAF domain-containing protein n=1 Tax=Deinococcus aquaticus TaxID=328692 RepID=UPI00360B7AC0
MSHVVLNARQAIYLSYDPASDTLNSTTTHGLPSQTPVHSQRRGQGLSWAAIAARDVIRVNNMDADQRILRVDGVGGGACLIAPLQTPDRLLGVLVVIRSHPFGENDAQLARTLADRRPGTRRTHPRHGRGPRRHPRGAGPRARSP